MIHAVAFKVTLLLSTDPGFYLGDLSKSVNCSFLML